MVPPAPAPAAPSWGPFGLGVPQLSLASLPIVTTSGGRRAGGALHAAQVQSPVQHAQRARQASQDTELQRQFSRLDPIQQLNVLAAVQHLGELQQAFPTGTYFLLAPGQEGVDAGHGAPVAAAPPAVALQQLQQHAAMAAMAAAVAPGQMAGGLWQVAGLPGMPEEPPGTALPGVGHAGAAAAPGWAAQQQPDAGYELLPVQPLQQPAGAAAAHAWLPFAAAPQLQPQGSIAGASEAGVAQGQARNGAEGVGGRAGSSGEA